jgi:hypothetical protein
MHAVVFGALGLAAADLRECRKDLVAAEGKDEDGFRSQGDCLGTEVEVLSPREGVDGDVGVEGAKMMNDRETRVVAEGDVDECELRHESIGLRQSVGEIGGEEEFVASGGDGTLDDPNRLLVIGDEEDAEREELVWDRP